MNIPSPNGMPSQLGLVILGLLASAVAHGTEHETAHVAGSMGSMEEHTDGGGSDPSSQTPSYFTHSAHRVLIYSHIVLMVVAWVFALPTAVMLSLARSRYTLKAQLSFLAVHVAGLVLGLLYNSMTPDLYPNNAHHKIGWVATVLAIAHVALSLVGRASGILGRSRASAASYQDLRTFIPVTASDIDEHRARKAAHRSSYDSGHGTDRATESLRSPSASSAAEATFLRHTEQDGDIGDIDSYADESLSPVASRAGWWDRWSSRLAFNIPGRAGKVLSFWYQFVDRTILLLGFIALCTGIVTFARFFEGQAIFSGLAHWIKGGVFFWLGIVTLGRWSGSFGDLGWAWNIRPNRSGQKWQPSAEFVESALIFFYGSTNIFLEHLGGWGGEWTHHDLEHLSITVLFIGGGLCGMFVESSRIRDLLNTTVFDASFAEREAAQLDEEKHVLTETPDQYRVSLNPIPALVIMLLGVMMSSHTQESMLSTMVHQQWGNLFSGAALARGLTYVIMYLKPPRTVFPSRPPTELLAAFCLISGGIIFMASSADTIRGMENYHLGAMFMYTVTMGLVGLLMSWVLFVLALKGWALRKEAV